MEKKEITLKKSQLLKLSDYLTNNKIGNKYFIEFVIRNKKQLEIEKEIFDKQFNETEEEKTYFGEEYQIISKYAVKDKDGNINYPVRIKTENVELFDKELKELQSNKKNIYDSIMTKDNERNQTLEEDVNLTLFTIHFDKVPDEIETSFYEILRELELVIVD
jgi:hypothetical protein